MRAATGLYIYIRCLHTYSGLPQAIGKFHCAYLFLFSFLFSPYGPCFELAPIAMPTFRVVPIVKITEGALHVCRVVKILFECSGVATDFRLGGSG